MAILLIRTATPSLYRTDGPDPGLGFLITSLRRSGIEVHLHDCIRQPISELKTTLEKHCFSQIGFKLYSKDLLHFQQILRVLRAKYQPDDLPPLVAGGPLPTGSGKILFDLLPEIQYVLCGEAESSYPQLALRLEETSTPDIDGIAGLVVPGSRQVEGAPQHFPSPLDALGPPDYSDMPPRGYLPEYATGEPYFPVVTTRGCPYNCTYCASYLMNGHRLRKHSADYLVDSMLRHHRDNDIRLFSIVDDNFTADYNHAHGLLEKLAAMDAQIRWRAPNGLRLDSLDADLIKLMERSGCTEVYLGFESGSKHVLADMNRHVTLEQYREKCALLAKHSHIRLMGFFILGYPTETREDVVQTIKFSRELPIHRAAFFFFTPHPGTAIYKELCENNELPKDYWKRLYYETPTMDTRSLSVRELKHFQRIALWKFYSRPIILKDLLFSIRGFFQWVRFIRKVLGVVLHR